MAMRSGDGSQMTVTYQGEASVPYMPAELYRMSGFYGDLCMYILFKTVYCFVGLFA